MTVLVSSGGAPSAGTSAGGSVFAANGGATGNASGGNASGGNASGGNASGGNASGGNVSGGGGNVSGRPALADGLVVHEWGTNTVVSASDGTLELGLQHEEEDLPPFVYDRLRSATAEPSSHKVTTKMETPILYFYSNQALDVSVRVDFPTGILTQWYPDAVDFRPAILWENPMASVKPLDPAFDLSVTLPTAECENRYRKNGWLDWGSFRVLGPSEAMPALPAAAKDRYTWSYARDVAANPLSFPNGEAERYLFYRGLSNALPPVVVRAQSGAAGRSLELHNTSDAAIPPVFVIRVERDQAAFARYDLGVAPHSQQAFAVPTDTQLVPLADYVPSLASAVTDALEGQALFHDEAVAMVNTWRRQWFTTPGVRVLYLAPSAWTNATIPLKISPTPAALVRVMVMRAEVLTPEVESADVSALNGADEGALQKYFGSLGRFAEPRLRRALDQSPSAAGKAYLAKLATGVSRNGPSE